MKSAPKLIDGAAAITFTPIDERHRPTRNCKHIVNGGVIGPATALAICKYDDAEGF
jgi:hypothetical protein